MKKGDLEGFKRLKTLVFENVRSLVLSSVFTDLQKFSFIQSDENSSILIEDSFDLLNQAGKVLQKTLFLFIIVA
ncbi:MAG: hypothetical protein ACPL7B_09770 [Candidatus Poribacteria bacterium]